MTVKDKLVQEVATRWWYALPEWPPVDFPFEEELKKRGYRLIRGAEFKFADEVVNGLSKVAEIDGYLGVFRTKHVRISLILGLCGCQTQGNCAHNQLLLR